MPSPASPHLPANRAPSTRIVKLQEALDHVEAAINVLSNNYTGPGYNALHDASVALKSELADLLVLEARKQWKNRPSSG